MCERAKWAAVRARGRGRGRSAHLWHLVLRLDFASEKTKSTQECGMGALALTPQADWSRPLAAVAAARRWASHVRAAAAAPLPSSILSTTSPRLRLVGGWFPVFCCCFNKYEIVTAW